MINDYNAYNDVNPYFVAILLLAFCLSPKEWPNYGILKKWEYFYKICNKYSINIFF